jgi:hypothetical protein
MSACGRE